MLNENALVNINQTGKIKSIDFTENQHPVVLQLGGCDPQKMGEAAFIAESWGYDEVNLNCGCPS